MKYEDFIIGQTYLYGGTLVKVIAKVEATKAIVTLDEGNFVTDWEGKDLKKFQPIDKMAVFTQKTHELVALGRELGYVVDITIEKKQIKWS